MHMMFLTLWKMMGGDHTMHNTKKICAEKLSFIKVLFALVLIAQLVTLLS